MTANPYVESFGLTDNPFCPRRPFLDVPAAYRKQLSALPLRLYEEPKLLQLYCEAFDEPRHFENFVSLTKDYGYDPELRELGAEPLAFVVHGAKGIGKTTLVNRMLYHLHSCAPEGQKWKIYGPWSEESMPKEWQIAQIEGIAKQIADEKPEYACVVLDDLVAGAENAASNLFVSAANKNDSIVFLFLVTSDLELIKKSWIYTRMNPHVYGIRPIKPEYVIRYIGHRCSIFRCDTLSRVIDPLYPFEESDIRRTLARQIVTEDSRVGVITIRMLNRLLCDALSRHKGDGNDAASEAEAEGPHRPAGRVIHLAEAYEEGLGE